MAEFPPITYPPPNMGDAGPFLVPAPMTVPTPMATAVDWVRAPACPNNATDCRITVTMTAKTTPPPPPVTDGLGEAQPALVLKALPHGDCSVCKLSWDITRGPLGPADLPPAQGVTPPTYPSH